MSNTKNSDGKIVMHWEGGSYLCETGDHKNCGGFCACPCHQKNGGKRLLKLYYSFYGHNSYQY